MNDNTFFIITTALFIVIFFITLLQGKINHEQHEINKMVRDLFKEIMEK